MLIWKSCILTSQIVAMNVLVHLVGIYKNVYIFWIELNEYNAGKIYKILGIWKCVWAQRGREDLVSETECVETWNCVLWECVKYKTSP